MSNKDHSGSYSEAGFWSKLQGYATKAGRALVLNALRLFYAMKLGKANTAQIAAIVAALGYFIAPIDAIPDALPGGFTDDAGVILAVINTVAACSDPEVMRAANNKLNEWF